MIIIVETQTEYPEWRRRAVIVSGDYLKRFCLQRRVVDIRVWVSHFVNDSHVYILVHFPGNLHAYKLTMDNWWSFVNWNRTKKRDLKELEINWKREGF